MYFLELYNSKNIKHNPLSLLRREAQDLRLTGLSSPSTFTRPDHPIRASAYAPGLQPR